MFCMLSALLLPFLGRVCLLTLPLLIRALPDRNCVAWFVFDPHFHTPATRWMFHIHLITTFSNKCCLLLSTCIGFCGYKRSLPWPLRRSRRLCDEYKYIIVMYEWFPFLSPSDCPFLCIYNHKLHPPAG